MKRNLNWLDRIMLAVSFAEANCPNEARGYLAEADKECACGCGEEAVDGSNQMHPAANHCH